MTVKIGTGSSASELTSVRVGTGSSNAEVQRVMVGTGSSAVEVWSARYTASLTVGGGLIARYDWSTQIAHTTARGGRSIIAGEVVFSARYYSSTYDIRILVNGSVVASESYKEHPNAVFQVSTLVDVQLAGGDEVALQVATSAYQGGDRTVVSASLSFT